MKNIDFDQLSLWGHSFGADDVFYAAKSDELNPLKCVMMMDPCFNAITDFAEPNGREFKGFPNDEDFYSTKF